MVKEM